jgi:TonB family protein
MLEEVPADLLEALAGQMPSEMDVLDTLPVRPVFPSASAADARMLVDGQHVIPALQLDRTHFIDMEYPPQPRNHKSDAGVHNGSVDLDFTVRADGSTADIMVKHAQPGGLYEDAAVQTVRQWRYAPVVRDGHPVDQRVSLRLHFRYRAPPSP